MRLPLSIPGPSDVVHAAGSLRDGAAAALALVPRVEALVQRLEDLVTDVEALVARVDRVAAGADAVVSRTGGLLDSAEATLARADGALDATDATLGRADGAVSGAQRLADRTDAMLGSYEPLLRSLQPSAARFVESVGEHEVDAGIALLDRLPVVLGHLDDNVIPILGSLDRVGPDIHELLEVVEDLRRMLAGIPGMRLLRRRADDDEPVELPDGVRGEK
jgi:hypothetical protein